MEGGALIIFLVIVFLLASFLLGIRDRRRAKRLLLQRIRASYGKAPDRTYDIASLQRIPKYFLKHRTADAVDDITWNDLNLDDFFCRINYCMSAAGEEVLYAQLRNLRTSIDADEEMLSFAQLEERYDRLTKDAALREQLQCAYAAIGRTGKYSVYDYLDSIGSLKQKSNTKEYIAYVVMVLSVVLLFIAFPAGILLLLAVLVYQLVTFYRRKAQMEPYLVCFDYILRLLKEGEEIRKALDGAFREEDEALRRIHVSLHAFERGAYLVRGGMGVNAAGSLFDIIMDYLNILFHISILKFNQMQRQLTEKKTDIDALLRVTGGIESCISIVCYRASLMEGENAAYCLPEFTETLSFAVQGLKHPLLNDAVPSDITANRGVLLTGSNASGKSTFLKSVALNALMAQTIHTCTAESYQAPTVRLYSSMALKDDVQGGDSYYMTEIKSLKRIVDAMEEEEKAPVLCCIDEVLRGTNTVERIAASTQVLRHLASKKGLVFAATHDGELTTLLKDVMDNYHFEGRIQGEDVAFDYRLKKGPSTARNAIALLRVMGYDGQLTKKAEEMGETFLREGTWRLAGETPHQSPAVTASPQGEAI